MSVESRLAARVDPAPPHVPTTTRRQFRADIQGLRALAVVLVLLEHAGLPFTPGGFIGVDVFFVISGFLISGHLVESLRADGSDRASASFYAARARRILPAALVTILATAVAAFVLVSPLRLIEILQDAVASALSVPNLLFAVRETDYLAGTAPSPFQHFWSLGVEEQFYLVWPALLLAVFLIARRSRRVLMTAIAVVTVASFVACVLTTTDAPSLAFFSPHTRAWEFGVGALIAGGAALLTRVPAAVARALTWVGLAAILLAALTYSADLAYPGVAVLLPVLGAALVIGFGGGTRGAAAIDGGGGPGSVGGAASLLARRPVQFVGAISYSLYLVHWPILVLVHERLGLGEPLPLHVGLAVVVVSVPVAWLLFRFVETPFRTGRSSPRARSGHRARRHRRGGQLSVGRRRGRRAAAPHLGPRRAADLRQRAPDRDHLRAGERRSDARGSCRGHRRHLHRRMPAEQEPTGRGHLFLRRGRLPAHDRAVRRLPRRPLVPRTGPGGR